MKYQKKLLPLLLIGSLIMALTLNPATALAWNENDEGNSEIENSSSINGELSGDTDVQGWIGTFDGEENPNRPDPPEEAWINVKIPTTALFGSLASDAGTIYSPTYHIYNYSVRGVTITPDSFTTENEPIELAGMSLNLDFSQPTALSVPLRNSQNEFLGAALSSPGSISLGAGSASNATTATFKINGTLPQGFTYPTNNPYTPTYKLTFVFEAQDPIAG